MEYMYRPHVKKRPVNLTIREDVLDAAKSHDFNMSHIAEQAILEALKDLKRQEWASKNKDFITAENNRIEKTGSLIKPYWFKGQWPRE